MDDCACVSRGSSRVPRVGPHSRSPVRSVQVRHVMLIRAKVWVRLGRGAVSCAAAAFLHRDFFSSLTKGAGESNWNTLNQQTHLSDNNEPRQKFYINLCRPLNPMSIRGEQCDLDASVCMTEFEESGVSSRGHLKAHSETSLRVQDQRSPLGSIGSSHVCFNRRGSR